MTGNDAHERRAARLALLAALPLFLLLAARFDHLVDDAFISFRYARHLAEGRGLVFNADGGAPVEGYSNLLWVLVLAGIERAGGDPTSWSRFLGVACGALLLWRVARCLAREPGAGVLGATAGTALLAALPPFAVWSTGGLETQAFALALFLVLESLACGARPRAVPAALSAAVAVLLRADGFVLVGLVLACAVLAESAPPRTARARVVTRAALRVALVAALTTGAHFLWRHGYYGEWLPNTARAKLAFGATALGRGALYVAALGLAVPSLLLALLLAPLGLSGAFSGAPRGGARPGPERAERLPLGALLVVLGTCAYAVTTGGDWMPFGRYVVPALPFLAVLAGVGLGRLAARRRALAGAAAAALVGLSLLPAWDVPVAPRAWRERTHFRYGFPEYQSEYALWRTLSEQVDDWVRRARVLARCTTPGESVILGAVGTTGYCTDLVVYDTYGLTDPVVAALPPEPLPATPGHDKRVDKTFFLPRRPTYYEFSVCPADAPPYFGLPPTFAAEPLRRLVELERHPLGPADGYPPGQELRLWRFVRFDLVPDALGPLLAALEGVDLGDPRAHDTLASRLDPDSARGRAVAAGILALMDEVEPQAVRYGDVELRWARLARPAAATQGYAVDALYLADAGLRHALAHGEASFSIALSGTPRFDGARPGWSVIAPGAEHDHAVAGGECLVLSFVPGGKPSAPH